MYNSQPLVFSNGECCGSDVGKEVDTVRGLVAGFTLCSPRADHEGGVPIPAPLSRVVTYDGHTNQLQRSGGEAWTSGVTYIRALSESR